MTDRLSELESRVAALTEALQQVERRLASLEGGRVSPAAARRARVAAAQHEATVASLRSDVSVATRGISLVGRTLLVLAGAFVLRALTDSGTLPAWLGVGLGFAYAGTWVAAADRAVAAGRRGSAAFHGAAAIVIGFPLLFEAASRFHLLSPIAAGATLAVFTAGALGVAVRRRFQTLGWLVALGGIVAATALMFATGRMVPSIAYLVLLGVATLWIGYVLDWLYLRWPAAVAADLAVALFALRAVSATSPEGPGTAIVVQLALMAAYLGSIATRTLLLKRDVVDFEIVQTAAVLLAGLGGASFVATRLDMGAVPLGIASVAFGLAAYGVAFAFVERQHERRTNFYLYTSVALVFVLAGSAFVLSGAALALAWSAFTVVSGALARGLHRRTLATHAAVYALSAAIAAGILEHGFESVFVSPAVPWTQATAAMVAVVLATALTAWLTETIAPRSAFDRLPRVVLVGLLATGTAGVLIGWIVPLLGGSPGAGANPGAVATVRTAVLAAGASLLALVARREGWLEAKWIAWAALVVTGVKILVEDLPRSRPATLFLSFALYGAALLLVPRLRRREAAREPAATDDSRKTGTS